MDEDKFSKKFTFNFEQAARAKEEIETQNTAVTLRINKIMNGFEIKGVPILSPILGVTHDPDELLRLAKALNRLAPLVAQQNKYSAQLKVLELAASEPMFFHWAFGDFSEFDINHLDKE